MVLQALDSECTNAKNLIQNHLKFQNLPLRIFQICMHDCNIYDSSKLLKNWTCKRIPCNWNKCSDTCRQQIWFFNLSPIRKVQVQNSHPKSFEIPKLAFGNNSNFWKQNIFFNNSFDQFGLAYKACVCYVFMCSFKSDSSQQC